MVSKVHDSFGRLVFTSGSSSGDRIGFTGREYEADLGIYYYRARFYDPNIGRFISRDPIGFAGGDWNIYRYVANCPVAFTDPFGLGRFAYKPLDFGTGIKLLPKLGDEPGSVDDINNTVTAHEHYFFDDPNENWGFELGGRFSEDNADEGYEYYGPEFDDDIMRLALKRVEDGDYNILGFWITNCPVIPVWWSAGRKNNCQDWAERLRTEYYKILEERNGCIPWNGEWNARP